MWNDLQGYLKFFFYGYTLRKKENDYRTKGKRYGRVLPKVKDCQRNTPYAKWIRYLKNERLYTRYKKDIMYIINKSICYTDLQVKEVVGFIDTYMIFNCYTALQVKEVVGFIDTYYQHSHFEYDGFWKRIYENYCFENKRDEINGIMARRLYHMDAPKVKHSRYIGSSYLKKSLWDTIVDKIFLIKHE